MKTPSPNPGPIVCMIFSTLALCSWAGTMGWIGEGSLLGLAAIQLAVFPAYIVGAVLKLKNGETFVGNTYMVFAVCFGAIGGATNLVGALSEGVHPFTYKFCGISWIVAGLFLLVMCIGCIRVFNKDDFLTMILGGIGVLGYGLTTTGIAPSWVDYIAAWALFFDAVAGLWSSWGTMLGELGVTVPHGKPFLSPKTNVERH